MKISTFSLIIYCCFLLACTKKGEFTTMTMLDKSNLIIDAVLLKSGIFTPTAGISVNGKAELRKRNTEHFVSLVNFNVSPGPDLKVYLSKSNRPSDFVNLGALENNKSVYNIPGSVILDEYSYVLIHCQQFNHLFAVAKLD